MSVSTQKKTRIALLAMPREEAKRLIRGRIKRGEDLKCRLKHTEPQFKKVREEYWTWTEYNEDMLELGYFMARVGRQNVCAIYRGDLELRSNYMEVIYVPFDTGGAWRFLLAKELKAAGFSIGMTKTI